MRHPKATFTGSENQALLALLEQIQEKTVKPNSTKPLEVTVQIGAEYHDPEGEWPRQDLLKSLKKLKLIESFKVSAGTDYLEVYGVVKTQEAKIKLVPKILTAGVIELRKEVAWELNRNRIEHGKLKFDQMTGRFEYYGVKGNLTGKQKLFLATLLERGSASYDDLFTAMNPAAKSRVNMRRLVSDTAREIKEKLGIKARGNPEIFQSISGFGYEII